MEIVQWIQHYFAPSYLIHQSIFTQLNSSPPPPILPVNKYCGLFLPNWKLIQFPPHTILWWIACPTHQHQTSSQLVEILFEGKFLCTVTSGQKGSKLDSRPVYCSQLYGNSLVATVGQATIQFWTLWAKGCGNHGTS